MPRSFASARERIAWAYACLACAHVALKAGRTTHLPTDYMVRAKLFAGLRDRRMSMRTIYDDEKLKLDGPLECSYCGSTERLTVDHLIARRHGGVDDGANLIRACAACNSSKRDSDLLDWTIRREGFPRLLVYRRYLKLVAAWTETAGLLDSDPDDPRLAELPFRIDRLPTSLPPLSDLTL